VAFGASPAITALVAATNVTCTNLHAVLHALVGLALEPGIAHSAVAVLVVAALALAHDIAARGQTGAGRAAILALLDLLLGALAGVEPVDVTIEAPQMVMALCLALEFDAFGGASAARPTRAFASIVSALLSLTAAEDTRAY